MTDAQTKAMERMTGEIETAVMRFGATVGFPQGTGMQMEVFETADNTEKIKIRASVRFGAGADIIGHDRMRTRTELTSMVVREPETCEFVEAPLPKVPVDSTGTPCFVETSVLHDCAGVGHYLCRECAKLDRENTHMDLDDEKVGEAGT